MHLANLLVLATTALGAVTYQYDGAQHDSALYDDVENIPPPLLVGHLTG